MKKLTAALMAFLMIFAAAAQAEETAFTFRNGVTFHMDMSAVTAAEPGRAETESERTRGGIVFTKAEYEDVTENGAQADLEYLFLENSLVAVRVKYDHGRMNYEALMKDLISKYGEAAAADKAALGSGVFAVDDDGSVKPDARAFTSGGLTVVVEREKDDDGEEIEITYLDMTAAYFTAR